MKPLFRFCTAALCFILLNHSNAGAQTISYFSTYSFCGTGGDSIMVNETGYASGDSVLFYYGDGTSSMEAPSYSSGTNAWYGVNYMYSSPGTYTVEVVLIRGGARVDSATSPISYIPCSYLTLQVYEDANSDCIYDAGDGVFWADPAEVEVDSAGVPVDTQWVTSMMWYPAYGPLGTVYTFKIINNPHGFLPSCPSAGSVSTTVSSYYTSYYDTIGFACDPTACLDNSVYGYTDLALFNGLVFADVYSSSCTAVSASLDITFSSLYSFSSAGGAPYTVSGNVVTFSFSSLSYSNPGYVYVNLLPVGTLSFGDTAHTTFKLNPYSGDCDTLNNYIATVDTIYRSYDPNHKSVSPDGTIAAGTNLQYTLGFENTGNDTAHNIHLLDTLSDNVDINSIKLVSASANCVMSLLTYSGHNIVKFDFPGINLPDSSHHGKCTGMVVFSINAKSGLAPGTKIDNEAGIYFDINPVVMTNPVENIIGGSTTGVQVVKASVVEVYPNPVNDNLNIKIDAGLYNTITIYNTLGQAVFTKSVNANLVQVNVSTLPAGMYYLNLRGDSGVKVVKFDKE